MSTYLNSLFQQMQGAGQQEILLAFAQLDNIDAYGAGNFQGAPDQSYDVVMALLASLQKNKVEIPGYSDFLSYLINSAHQNGMKVTLSFGGGDGTDITMKIIQNAEETYRDQACKLADFLQKYNIDSLDFDIEDTTILSSQGPDSSGGTFLDFFQTVHSLLAAQKKRVTLTTALGSILRTAFASLLTNFTTYFDGLNLMAYSDTKYWLDPRAGSPDQGWAVEEWIDAIGKQNMQCICIGFDDGVPYASGANGGVYPFTVQPGSTNGEAAAQIYLQLKQQLAIDGYTDSLGAPFFWPASSVSPNGKSRYAPTGTYTSNFVSEDMQDFYNWLNVH